MKTNRVYIYISDTSTASSQIILHYIKIEIGLLMVSISFLWVCIVRFYDVTVIIISLILE